MKRIYILCIEDEPEVLGAVVDAIAPLEDSFPIETAQSADQAKEILEEIRKERSEVGLILCDHVLPGENGVDLLVEWAKDPMLALTRKVLITGQAGLEATVEAINRGGLHYYIGKPWKDEELLKTARHQLTEYVVARKLDLLPFMRMLDTARLAEEIRRQQGSTDA